MENLNLHKQKLYALIVAGVGLISILLPWSSGKGQFAAAGENGFHSWGLLSFLGVVAVAIASLLGDKAKVYEGQMRMVAIGGFAAMAFGAVMWLVRIMTGSQSGPGYTIKNSDIVSPGFGLFTCMIAGLVGLGWVLGLIKIPDAKPPTPPTPPSNPI